MDVEGPECLRGYILAPVREKNLAETDVKGMRSPPVGMEMVVLGFEGDGVSA